MSQPTKQSLMSVKDMKKGDILKGKNNIQDDGRFGHPIVFLRQNDTHTFIGAMLTSSGKFGENISMEHKHFNVTDEFTFRTQDTWVVSGGPFIKKMEWAPFKKVGELSKEGIKFVESHLTRTNPVLFSEHKKQRRRIR